MWGFAKLGVPFKGGHRGIYRVGYHFGGPHNKDYSILGSISGSPFFGKLPCMSGQFASTTALQTEFVSLQESFVVFCTEVRPKLRGRAIFHVTGV